MGYKKGSTKANVERSKRLRAGRDAKKRRALMSTEQLLAEELREEAQLKAEKQRLLEENAILDARLRAINTRNLRLKAKQEALREENEVLQKTNKELQNTLTQLGEDTPASTYCHSVCMVTVYWRSATVVHRSRTDACTYALFTADNQGPGMIYTKLLG
ncbi:hypothetical protein BD626DRAFT_16731 [Schizophyllum amplum]|uniref:Uncharacterized protein n=1 Tax=Schizophyllum amplum TaxID=97359 RepID=A0A550CY33_9AGAR|nr:hypothetical protein BD626DRAFT_16731 [Auriculariopsis ampla]